MTLNMSSIFSISYIIYFIFISKKNKMPLLTGVYGHVGHHILHEEDKNRRRNTALEYDPKEEKPLLYFLLYVKHPEEYT